MGHYFDVRRGFGNDKDDLFPNAPKAYRDHVNWGDYSVLKVEEATALSFGLSPLKIKDYLSNPDESTLDEEDIFYDRVEQIKRAVAGGKIRTVEPDPTTGEVRILTEDVVKFFEEQARKVPEESQGELPSEKVAKYTEASSDKALQEDKEKPRCSCDTRLFDETHEYYAPELAIAIRAWQAVTSNPSPNKAAKAQIKGWLEKESHQPRLSQEAKERIATVCNWNKQGGAPQSK